MLGGMGWSSFTKSVKSFAGSILGKDTVKAAGDIATSGANVLTLGGANTLNNAVSDPRSIHVAPVALGLVNPLASASTLVAAPGGYTRADAAKDVLNTVAPGVVTAQRAAVVAPRRTLQNQLDQAQAQADAAAAYAKALIPQTVDLAEIRRQRIAQFQAGAGSPGTKLGATSTTAKTLLGL